MGKNFTSELMQIGPGGEAMLESYCQLLEDIGVGDADVTPEARNELMMKVKALICYFFSGA